MSILCKKSLCILCIVLCIFMMSCKSINKNSFSVIHKHPITIVNSLPISRPAKFYYTNNHLIVEDLRSSDFFYKMYCAKTGKFIRGIAQLGNAGNEFTSPTLTLLYDGNLLIADMNRGNAVKYSFEKDTINEYKKVSSDIVKRCPLINSDENVFISLNNSFINDSNNDLFKVFNNDSEIGSFGEFPIKEKISAKHEIYRGSIEYNSDKETLVFFSSKIPYCAIYKKNNDNYELIKEKIFGDYGTKMDNGKLKIEIEKNDVNNYPVNSFAITKDYIIKIGKTNEDVEFLKQTAAKGYNNMSRSLYIYDYSFELIKVISTNTSIIDIVGDKKANTVYMITYIDAEFGLSSIEV